MLFSPLSIGIDSLLLSLFPTKSPCPFFKSCIDEQKDRRREILAAVLPCIVTCITKETTKMAVSFVLALPIFPARLQASIFGASELNFRVRDGNGWTLTAINTNLLFLERKSKQKELYAFFLPRRRVAIQLPHPQNRTK